MSTKRYTPEFKDEAVRQVADRGYSVAEVADRLGVSAHSLHKWVKAVKPDQTSQQVTELIEAKSEILKLRAQLRRMEEERDILKKPRGTLPGRPSEVPLHQRASSPIRGRCVMSNVGGSAQRLLCMGPQTAVRSGCRRPTFIDVDPLFAPGQRKNLRLASDLSGLARSR